MRHLLPPVFPIFDALVGFFDYFQPEGCIGMAKTEKAKKTISVKNKAASASSRSSTPSVVKKSAARLAAKSPATKTTTKSTAQAATKKVTTQKATTKMAAKTAPKAPPKATAKTAAKTVAKVATKTPAKLASKSAQLQAKKSSVQAKTSAKATPKASRKISKIAKDVKSSQSKSTQKQQAKTRVATVVAKPEPVKSQIVKAQSTKTQSVKAASVKTVEPKANSPKTPIVVKAPLNQNMPQIARATPVAALAPHKLTATQSSANLVKPAYRPIQVINKPLTPAQPHRAMAPMQKPAEKAEFKKGDYVCYPAHGVGEIEAVETQMIGGMEIKLYAIAFEKDRMRLKVPVARAHASGLRKLSSAGRIEDAMKTLQGRAQVRRAMWSRRAQEYETKINSGDPVSIAEVLRDLKRSNDDNDQSYSERQIYQSALERLAREVAAVEKITEIEASERLENMIRGRKARAAAQSESDASSASLNEEAA